MLPSHAPSRRTATTLHDKRDHAGPTRRLLMIAGAGATVLSTWVAKAVASSPTNDLADLVSTLLPSVVTVRTVVPSPTGTSSFVGSGFVITSSGVIATNRHVVAGAATMTVTVPDIGVLPASPLYVAEYLDFALLKVAAPRPLQAVTLGDSDTVRIGDTVLLLGNPMGIGESLSVGVISALDRDIGEGRLDRFFQTDAAINHGNSGGPMFNLKGEVIGINTGFESSPGNQGSIGIGFTLPINDVKIVIDQYLRNGKVVVGSTGVRAQRLTAELAAAFGIARAQGSIITEVLPGGSAAGKLRPGDIMLKVGSQDASDTNAIARLIVTSPPKTMLAVTFLRDGREYSTSITVTPEEIDPLKALALSGPAPAQAARYMRPSDPGLDTAAIGPADRARLLLRGTIPGIVVTHVDPRGAAAQAIEVGDVIMSVDGTPISLPAQLSQRLRTISDDGRTYAALLVTGERGTRWVALPLQADH